MSAIQQYLDLFASQRTVIEEGSCPVMNAERQTAFDNLQQHGLPTQKVERYKYTDLEKVLAPDYGLNLKRILLSVDPYEVYRCSIPKMSADVAYVVNDTVVPAKLSFRENAEFIKPYYNRLATQQRDAVSELNTMLAQDGILIHIPAGKKLERPLQIVNVSAATIDFMSNRRVLIVAEEGAEGTILFCDESPTEQRSLTTQVVEIFAGKNSKLHLYSLEETADTHTHLSNMYIEQQERSEVTFNGMTLHNGTTRNLMDVHLVGRHAAINAYGAVIANAQEHVDNNILIDHNAEECTSDLLYKYVLDDKSVGAFAEKVLVQAGAQKTASQETNSNLCVSPDARAYAQPMLEIYADDVKCNHGSTVGKLDENALFYMRQRGIPEQEARLLLQHAFINDVLQHVTLEPLRERLSHLVELRFRGELRHCDGCKMQDICN